VLDTGAEVTVLTKGTCKRIGLHLSKPSKALLGAGGEELDVMGEADVSIRGKLKPNIAVATVYVVEGAKRNLLGIEQIRSLGLLAIVNSVCEESINPQDKPPRLFGGLRKMPRVLKTALRPGVEPVMLCAPRAIAHGLRDEAKAEQEGVSIRVAVV